MDVVVVLPLLPVTPMKVARLRYRLSLARERRTIFLSWGMPPTACYPSMAPQGSTDLTISYRAANGQPGCGAYSRRETVAPVT